MVLYGIVTTDEFEGTDINDRPPTGIFFATATEESGDLDAIEVTCKDQFIEYIVENNEEIYKFKPSNMVLKIINNGDNSTIYFIQNNLNIVESCYNMSILTKLKQFLSKLIAKQAGRHLISVQRIGKHRTLPENVESVIAGMFSGKKGSMSSQRKQLKNNTLPTVKGGKRNTRKIKH